MMAPTTSLSDKRQFYFLAVWVSMVECSNQMSEYATYNIWKVTQKMFIKVL